MFKHIRVASFLSVFALAAAAQSPESDWNNVKVLAVGTSVRISVGSRAASGQVQGVTDDSLTVNSGKGQESFPRLEILQVSVKEKGHRGRNMLIGLGIGAGVGAALGVPLCGGGSGYDCSRGLSAGIGAGVLGVIGALASAFFHTGGWNEVYQR